MNIILCGPPFTGKTTFGKLVAEQLRWPFVDTDRLLENCYFEDKKVSLSCKEIHRKEGEEKFRQYEYKAIQTLKANQKSVIALGGGSLNKIANAQLIKELGYIIYLKTSLKTLESRLLSQTLPSYLEQEQNPLGKFEEIVNQRSYFYERYANAIVETDFLSQTQIVSIICEGMYGK